MAHSQTPGFEDQIRDLLNQVKGLLDAWERSVVNRESELRQLGMPLELILQRILRYRQASAIDPNAPVDDPVNELRGYSRSKRWPPNDVYGAALDLMRTRKGKLKVADAIRILDEGGACDHLKKNRDHRPISNAVRQMRKQGRKELSIEGEYLIYHPAADANASGPKKAKR